MSKQDNIGQKGSDHETNGNYMKELSPEWQNSSYGLLLLCSNTCVITGKAIIRLIWSDTNKLIYKVNYSALIKYAS